NLSGPALAAAEAAMGDRVFAAACFAENEMQRARLRDGLLANGIACDPSQANFVLARFADEAEARDCDAFLQGRGILVRHVAAYGLPHCLRMTVGTADGVDRLLDAIAAWRAGL
ncbi:MAG: aminotransferase class I/II-fold pyridoxal phosphate-dependent enzyme, partial [Pseudomonadota bacterium]